MIDIKAIASGSSGNCYRVSDGSTALLLDAGISIYKIQQGLDFRLSEIAGALISHEHMDHAKAVPDLAKRGVLVFGPPEVAKRARAHPSFLGRRFGGSPSTHGALYHSRSSMMSPATATCSTASRLATGWSTSPMRRLSRTPLDLSNT